MEITETGAENRSSVIGKAVSLVLCKPFQSDAQGNREAVLVMLIPDVLAAMDKRPIKRFMKFWL